MSTLLFLHVLCIVNLLNLLNKNYGNILQRALLKVIIYFLKINILWILTLETLKLFLLLYTDILLSLCSLYAMFMCFSLVKELRVPHQKMEFSKPCAPTHQGSHPRGWASLMHPVSLTLEPQMMMSSRIFENGIVHARIVSNSHPVSSASLNTVSFRWSKTNGKKPYLLEVHLMPHQSKSCMCYYNYPLSPWFDKASCAASHWTKSTVHCPGY